jgi:hypothetical protein
VYSGYTALCVCAARGLSKVLKTLLEAGAKFHNYTCSGRFRIYSSSHEVVCGTFSPSGWCEAMVKAETEAGVALNDLVGLKTCQRLLAEALNKEI